MKEISIYTDDSDSSSSCGDFSRTLDIQNSNLITEGCSVRNIRGGEKRARDCNGPTEGLLIYSENQAAINKVTARTVRVEAGNELP